MRNSVKVYTTDRCPWCVKVKRYLKNNNIRYEEIDVGMDRRAAYEMSRKTGQMSVPVVEINGNIVIGFDKDQIDNLLDL